MIIWARSLTFTNDDVNILDINSNDVKNIKDIIRNDLIDMLNL